MTAARAALAVAFISVVLAGSGKAAVAAEPRLRVLLVIEESDDPFAERIRAEVTALGLEVVLIEPWRTGEPVESLDAAGRTSEAAAAIRMVASRKGVEVWMANQPTGRSLLRQLIVDERPGAPNEGLVALQTAELLRTTLLSRSEVPTAPRTPPVAPPQIEAPKPPPEPPSLALQAASGVLFSPGEGEPAFQAWLTLSRVIARPFGVALDVSAPLRPSTIRGPEGSANLRSWLFGATLFVRREWASSKLYASAAGGLAAIRLDATATANEPFLASAANTTAGAIYARADVGFGPTRWLHIGARAVAGVVPQGVTVLFAGNHAAEWGRPFLAGLLLVDLSW